MFDKNEELISVISPEDLLENEQVQELNGLITTIVSAPYSKELESAFYIGSRDIDDNNIFWLYKVDKRTKENNNIILNGTYSLFDDLKAYDVIRDKRPSNASALVGINTVLEGSRWQVGNITSTHTGTANWYYVSRLEAFWEYLENWNVEFKPRMTFSKGKITGRYIDIVDKLSEDYGKWYEYGDKLLQVTAEQASDSLYTAFIGRGKGEESGNGYGRRIGFEKVVWTTASGKPVNKPLNQDYVEITSATELYGYSDGKPRITVVEFQDTESPEVLLQQTYDYALNECRPKLQMKANVIENGLSELGEVCTIIRDDIGIRYKTRVFKITRNFLNKNQKTVEFGDEVIISTAKRNSNTGKIIKKQEQQMINWLDALQLELLDSYFNEDGYNYDLKADNEYDLPGGFYSFNAPIDQNPTKVIYMGAGTLAIANSKLPNGQWNFRTWGNGDGFTADLINAGTLDTGLITISGGSSTNYIIIDGTDIATHGVFTRSWGGETDIASLRLGLYGGRVRVTNDTTGYNLYMTEKGLSTTMDGAIDQYTSGTLEFHSQRFNEESRGVTLHSSYGTVALVSDHSTIVSRAKLTNNIESDDYSVYIRPFQNTREGLNEFQFYVKDNVSSNDTDGALLYGNITGGSTHGSGIRFSKQSTSPTVYATNPFGDIGTGDFNARNMYANDFIGNLKAPETNTYAMTAYDGEFRVTDKSGYNNGDMTFRPVVAMDFRPQSSERIKTDIVKWDGPILDTIIDDMQIYQYRLKQTLNTPEDRIRHGLIVERETPKSIIAGTGIDLYEFTSWAIKGLQEAGLKIRSLETKIQQMESVE